MTNFTQPSPQRSNSKSLAKKKAHKVLLVYMPNVAVIANAGGAKYANSSYYPGDLITLADGASYTISTQPVIANVTVTTLSVTPSVNAGGTNGTTGFGNVTGTTGTGTKFVANVSISGGAINAVNSLISNGLYTVNPTSLIAEPVTGANLTGATLVLGIGVANVVINNTTGQVITIPTNPVSQYKTSGNGAGATFTLTYNQTGEI